MEEGVAEGRGGWGGGESEKRSSKLTRAASVFDVDGGSLLKIRQKKKNKKKPSRYVLGWGGIRGGGI